MQHNTPLVTKQAQSNPREPLRHAPDATMTRMTALQPYSSIVRGKYQHRHSPDVFVDGRKRTRRQNCVHPNASTMIGCACRKPSSVDLAEAGSIGRADFTSWQAGMQTRSGEPIAWWLRQNVCRAVRACLCRTAGCQPCSRVVVRKVGWHSVGVDTPAVAWFMRGKYLSFCCYALDVFCGSLCCLVGRARNLKNGGLMLAT